jgi:murein DD-endopeptidase MepM/ murein hydrolase activator NlpD
MTLFPNRSALILLATTALVSASSPTLAQMPRPNFPIRQEQVASEVVSTAMPEATPRREDRPMPAVPEPEGIQSRPLEQLVARREPPPAATAAYAPPARSFEVAERSTKRHRVAAKEPERTYKVKKGDNLAGIARKMGVDLDDLAKQNGLKSPYRLKAGQVLKAPGGGAPAETKAEAKEAKSEAKSYVVGKGDTLYAIGRKLGFTPKEIADANNMSVRKGLSAGQRLVLPGADKDKEPARKQAREVAEPETPAPKTRHGRAKPAEAAPETSPPERTSSGSTVKTSVTGKVIEVEGGPTSHKVRKGDSVDEIADAMGISRKELAQLNKLKVPYPLHLGQVLKGPPKQVKAYVPVEGDTLALIGKRFNVTAKAIAAANNMRSGASVRPGKRLILPSGVRDKGPLKETIRQAPAAPAYTPPPYNPPPERPAPERPTPTPVTPQPYRPPAYTPPAYTPPPLTPAPNRPAAQTSATGPLSDSQISSLGRGRFQWPLRGDIMSEFGPKGTGQRNDGINIRARDGDPVRAAAVGDVVYAGDQVPGFGNLVLVKHADGWVTAYGHLGRVDVKMQQKVVQGQQLGMAGVSGGVSEPQLHFEVRYAPSPTERARPVDPQLVLGK